jgi:uncharacterized NAD-dependent epimerase/dehydratase family protein
MQSALVIANHNLKTLHGKTTHGLVRKCERYNIVGVIDPECAGENLSQILKGAKDLPIFVSVTDALTKLKSKPNLCITGIAVHGGKIPEEVKIVMSDAIKNGMSIINSLHEFISDNSDLKQLAEKHQVTLTDIRKPRPTKELRFWNGDIYSVKAPIIAILGTDCALGKRTTTQLLLDSCKKNQINAHMIYTGQTGWLQGAKYGFIFDVTANDFVSGELEGAIVNCYKNENPDLILLEGQSALRNPSGPCGAEFLLSGNAKNVILQHSPHRVYFEGYEELRLKLPAAKEEIKLIEAYGSQVIAIAMNSEGLNASEITSHKEALAKETGKPVFSILEDGAQGFIPHLKELIKNANR